jgi:hypothetical protein
MIKTPPHSLFVELKTSVAFQLCVFDIVYSWHAVGHPEVIRNLNVLLDNMTIQEII